jgi:hypothetical protein
MLMLFVQKYLRSTLNPINEFASFCVLESATLAAELGSSTWRHTHIHTTQHSSHVGCVGQTLFAHTKYNWKPT